MIYLKAVSLRVEKADLALDRRSRWGNPFRVGVGWTVDQVIDAFAGHFQNEPWQMHLHLCALNKEIRKRAQAHHISGEQTFTLGCWCKPARCHVDVWIDKLLEAYPHTFGRKEIR